MPTPVTLETLWYHFQGLALNTNFNLFGITFSGKIPVTAAVVSFIEKSLLKIGQTTPNYSFIIEVMQVLVLLLMCFLSWRKSFQLLLSVRTPSKNYVVGQALGQSDSIFGLLSSSSELPKRRLLRQYCCASTIQQYPTTGVFMLQLLLRTL